MLGTLVRRITIATLDTVIEQGHKVDVGPVRWAASALDTAREWVGLHEVQRETPLPDWTGTHPEQPMWDSDLKKLRKWQADQGIVKSETTSDEGESKPRTDSAPVVVFYKRGCPYTRAAMDLLREREIVFEGNDIKGDDGTASWLRIVTGRKTTPQIFIKGQSIGGFDELRTLDQSGELAKLLGDDAGQAQEADDDELPEITVAELKEKIDDGVAVRLLDVRTVEEVAAGVIDGSVHIPLDQLKGRLDEVDKAEVWIAVCLSGKRSLTAADVLMKNGVVSAVSLAGGIQAWTQSGGEIVPLAKSRKRVSLNVVGSHPERSPFEGLGDLEAGSDEVLEGDALIERVKEVLGECRPMVQADGGDIELLDVQADIVHVQLTGNCVGCPSSQATLKQGIERRLTTKIPQIKGIASPQLA